MLYIFVLFQAETDDHSNSDKKMHAEVKQISDADIKQRVTHKAPTVTEDVLKSAEKVTMMYLAYDL